MAGLETIIDRRYNCTVARRSTATSILLGTAALVFVEDLFAEAQACGRGFDELVGSNVFERALEAHLDRRVELDALAVALGAHIREGFRLAWIHRHVVGAGVFADDHAGVNRVAGADEEAAAFLDVVDGKTGRVARFHGDEHAVKARENFADFRAVFLEQVAHDSFAAGQVDEVGFKTDQAARGDRRFHRDAVGVVVHVGDFTLAIGEILEDVAQLVGGSFHVERFERLEHVALFVLVVNDLGARDHDLKALAAHLLDENGDLHFTAGADFEDAGAVGIGQDDADVGAGFAHEAVADMARGEEFSFAAGQRRVVDDELHLDRGRIDVDEGHGFALLGIGEGFTDEDVFKPGEADDVARAGHRNLDLGETGVGKNLGDSALFFRAVLVDADDLVAHRDFASGDFAVSNPAQVIAIVEIGDEHFEVLVEIGLRGRNLFDDGLVERGHAGVAGLVIEMALPLLRGKTELGRGIDGGEIELRVGRVEFEEELEDHVEHLVRTGVFAIDLVDDDDGLGAHFERLAKHELGLRLRAVEGIDDEHDAVDHLENALHFAAEIGVTGGVDDVDVIILVLERGVFGLDRDAFFALEIHRIHDAFDDGLVGAKGARLAEELIHERGLAVVNVGDNGDVANLLDDFHKNVGGA
jgi:hypothetical protein